MAASQTRWELKRAYEAPTDADGFRVLVDRLWPRGLSKAEARIDRHDVDVAPSAALRQWYGHDPSRYGEFAERYAAELDASGADRELVESLAGVPWVTLVIATRDVAFSQGPILLQRVRELCTDPEARRGSNAG